MNEFDVYSMQELVSAAANAVTEGIKAERKHDSLNADRWFAFWQAILDEMNRRNG